MERNVFKNTNLINISNLSVEEVLEKFNTSDSGLSSQRAGKLLSKKGKNVIESEKGDKWHELLIESFFDSFNIVLFIIIIISILTDVVFTTDKTYSKIIILSIIITISGLIHYIQGIKTKKSLAKLKEMVSTKTAVKRDDKVIEISPSDIVVGDIIKLAAGDIVPADLRIISSKDLYINQSVLTGESEPVEKHFNNNNNSTNIFELQSICYMGTNVISGTAYGVVIATSNDTYYGKIAKSLSPKSNDTAFDISIKRITSLLIKMTFIMAVLVFLFNAITKGNMIDSLIYAVAVAVGVMPELLLVIVTSNLAKGSIEMAKKKTIIKELQSIQNFGAMDVLCTDKTGTLTEDHVVLQRYLDVYGNDNIKILEDAYLNSYLQTGLKNLLDIAVIEKAEENGLTEILNKYKKADEIPYDFSRRRMSVVVGDPKDNNIIITKGAVEEILSICSSIKINKGRKKITDKIKEEILNIAQKLNEDGLRVIAIAKKIETNSNKTIFSVEDENEMELIGYVAFLDPPKESAKEAIVALHEHGVKVKVITGDNEIITQKICKEVNISTENILLGQDIDNMSEEEFSKAVEKTTIFAKISPLQKSNIIQMLQKNGHVVGFLGDGINDAPALLQSDIGISVDTGTEITKEVANVILLEKNLMVLEEGIVEGRKVFANINKYFKMAVSSNIGNMFSVLIASIILPFLPMLPIHVLIQNLLYDLSQLGIPFDNVDKEYVKKPKKWEITGIKKFIWWFAPISTIFDLITFAVLWFILGANSIDNQALFHSGWFILGVLSQTIIVHIIRTSKIPFFKSRSSIVMVLTTVLISIVALIIPYSSFGELVQLVPLPKIYIIWVVIIIAFYIVLTEITKKRFIKNNKEWI